MARRRVRRSGRSPQAECGLDPLAFVLLTLLGGLGALIYVSCWLIVPEQGDEAGAPGPSGIVVLAQATDACAGLVMLGALAVVATIFGFGWGCWRSRHSF